VIYYFKTLVGVVVFAKVQGLEGWVRGLLPLIFGSSNIPDKNSKIGRKFCYLEKLDSKIGRKNLQP
jgi:hypothetical protein